MNQQSNILRVLKNAIALFAGKASLMAFSFFFFIYAARMLGVEDFGKYSLARGFHDLFLSLCTAGLMNVITREIAKKNEFAIQYMSSSFLMATGLVFLGCAILIVIANVFPYSSDTRLAIYLGCIALVPSGLTMIYQAGFVAFEKAEYTTYGIMVENVVRTGLSILALTLGYGLLSLFTILIFSRVVMLLFYWVLWNRKIVQMTWYYNLPFIKDLYREWKVFAAEGWMSDLAANLDYIALSVILGEAAVGLYSAAFRVVGIGMMVANSYTTATFPYMSQLWVDNKEKFRRFGENSVKYMFATVLPVVTALAIIGDRIIVLLFTNEYEGAIPLFRILIWVLVFRFVNPFLSFMLFAQGRQRKSLQVISITLAFYAVNLLWMTEVWGEVGTAAAVLITMTFAFVQYFRFALGKQGIREEQRQVYLRIVALAGGIAVFVWVLRDFYLIPLGILTTLVYLALFMLLRVPSEHELEIMRDMFLKVWQIASSRLPLSRTAR
jgi:O-antigen/teichoic acid export membrane protein